MLKQILAGFVVAAVLVSTAALASAACDPKNDSGCRNRVPETSVGFLYCDPKNDPSCN